MLKLIQKDNLLYFTEQERTEYDLECTTLIYTFPDLTYNEEIKGRVRPFRALWEKKKELYKLNLLDYLPELIYTNYHPNPTSKEEYIRITEEVEKIALMMGIEKEIDFSGYDIRYECDIWNALEDFYGKKLIALFKNFFILPTIDQELVRKVWMTSKNRRLEAAHSGNWVEIFEYLPPQTQTELLIFGNDNKAGNEGSVLEFRKKELIGPKFPNLREKIYQEFSLGEFLLEGARDVKDRLEKIYKECGIEKSPKAKDLEEWFVIFPCRQKGKRGFRIDFRR